MFADHRSMSEHFRFVGAPADPLLHLLAEQDYETTKAIHWMLRVMDVRGALEARGWPAGVAAELHLDVNDDVLPWNHGRFAIEIADGKAKVRKGGRGRIRLDVRALASMYSGHMTPAALALTGQLEAPGKDVAVATGAFAGAAPWMPDFF
jgi:predicted acetyltransferase